MKTTKTRGFTLIELLVVIAIIGILSAVVLASLNSARAKGKDASVKSNMHSMSNALTLYYDSHNNSYGTAIAAPASPYTTASLLAFSANSGYPYTEDKSTNDAANAAYSASAGSFSIATGVTGATYAVAFLLTSANGWWCVDSNGISKLEAGATMPALGGGAAAAACP